MQISARTGYRVQGTGYRPDVDDADVKKALHRLIKKVGDDIESMKFNTAISSMMEFVNLIKKRLH